MALEAARPTAAERALGGGGSPTDRSARSDFDGSPDIGREGAFVFYVPWFVRPRHGSKSSTVYDIFRGAVGSGEDLERIRAAGFLVRPSQSMALEAIGKSEEDVGTAVPDALNSIDRGVLVGWDWQDCVDHLDTEMRASKK